MRSTAFCDRIDQVHGRVGEGGAAVRIRLSTACGSLPLEVTGATVATTAEGASVRPGSVRRVTFRGGRSASTVDGDNRRVHLRVTTPNPEVAPAELIAGYRELIRQAHARGVRIVVGTLSPFKGAGYYTAEGEAVRDEVNAWIRTSGEFDAVPGDGRSRRPVRPVRGHVAGRVVPVGR